MKKLDYTAKLLVYGLPEMTKREVRKLAGWLRMQADDLSLSPKEYSDTYTARLMK